MKPVQTHEVQELIYELALETPVTRPDLVKAAETMLYRLQVEKEQKAQAIAFAALDDLAQANIKPLDSEKESLKEENRTLKQLLKDTVQLL